MSVTITLCAGRTAERWTVLLKTSVDALSIGISTSTNCDPPSDAVVKRTTFMEPLRKLGTPGLRGKRSQRRETASLNDAVAAQGSHGCLIEAEPVVQYLGRMLAQEGRRLDLGRNAVEAHRP